MSNHPHRSHHRSRRRQGARLSAFEAAFDKYGHLCVELAATDTGDPEEIEAAKRVTHDAAIEAAADNRRSGIAWRLVPPAEIDEAMDRFATFLDVATADQYRAWFVTRPEGWLVVAYCVVDAHAH